MTITATSARFALDTLPDIEDAAGLDAIRSMLISCHQHIRIVTDMLRSPGAQEFANMLLLSLENEIDGVAASAFLIAEG